MSPAELERLAKTARRRAVAAEAARASRDEAIRQLAATGIGPRPIARLTRLDPGHVHRIISRITTILALAAALAIPASALAYPGDNQFYVSTTGVPAEVGVERFVHLAADTGARQGLVYVGTTPLLANADDGRNIVGFGSLEPFDVLAATPEYPTQRVFARWVRRCSSALRARSHQVVRVRSCARRAVRRSINQVDIVVDPGFSWAAGPAYPALGQFDLETVLLHEFGHFAGLDHVSGCGLMAARTVPGEWYRSDTDYSRADCPRPAP